MAKISTDLNTHQEGIRMNGEQRMFADKALRTAHNVNDDRITSLENNKQDNITDLEAIRNGASKGATALQTHQDISGKADKATTLSGYGITDAYTKTAADSAISNAVNTEKNRAQEAEKDMQEQIAWLLAMNKCAGIRWKLGDSVKVIEYVGDSALKETIMNWIDNSPKPCEVKKDGTDFAYLTNTAGVASSTNWETRADGSDSKYKTNDEGYLQMVELQNINMRFVTDETAGTAMVLFNLDEDCPGGFHRWFLEPTKLFARYDSTNNATAGFDVCRGKSQAYVLSVDAIHTRNKATGNGVLELTMWEYAVYTWLMAFKYGSFNTQLVLGAGVQSGSQAGAEAFVNGYTDSLTTPHGKVAYTGGNSSGNEAIRFMYIENPYGLRWLWCSGARQDKTLGLWTRDDLKANAANIVAKDDCEESYTIPALSSAYAKNVNILGICSETGGSATSGFFDGNWSNISAQNFLTYVGGDSGNGVLAGGFARHLNTAVSYSTWTQRGRCALRKSAVVPA